MSTSNKKLLVDRDRLMNASRSRVAEACVNIFDRIQALPKDIQVLALAAAFILTTTASRIDAQEAFTATKNLMYDPITTTRTALEFQAMKFHLETEVLSND